MSHLQVIYLIINEKEYDKYSYIAALEIHTRYNLVLIFQDDNLVCSSILIVMLEKKNVFHKKLNAKSHLVRLGVNTPLLCIYALCL